MTATAPAPHPHERVVWRSPRVLAGGDAPGLLGFGTDNFMAQLEASLTAEPPTTATHLAAPEHWSDSQPPMFAVPARPAHQPRPDLTLFQPAHGRFYLIAAHLCCRRFGFPDRRLSDAESVGFVLRRVEPADTRDVDPDDPSTFTELAWAPTGQGGSWVPVTHPLTIAPGEEVLPLAPTVHTVDGRRSRLLTGLIPVGARERYESRTQTTPIPQPSAPDLLANPHRALLDSLVIDAVRQLLDLRGHTPPATADLAEMLSWALLDLIDFVTKVVRTDLTDVFSHLGARAVPPPGSTTWKEVVALVSAEQADLLAGESPVAELQAVLDAVQGLELSALIDGLTAYRDNLPDPPAPSATTPPVTDPDPIKGLLYVARCVYRRADCPFQRPEWVSAPTVPFRFASFFDPDAPVRPVQISLPVDLSQRGLRSFPRSVSVLVSKKLRSQIQQVKKIDEFGDKGSFDLGMLCSLSIPIITIAALILLMLIVGILNIVFFWLPLFKICLPTPEVTDGPR